MTDGIKSGIAADNNFSGDANKRKRSGKEMRECAAEKKRVCALRLCFSVEFICWLRALKEEAADFFVCDCREMLDKRQSA